MAPSVKRKPAPPTLDDNRKPAPPTLDHLRYPTPDPADPFAPLWVLRTRSSNNSLKHLDFSPPRDHSTPHKRSHSTPPSALFAQAAATPASPSFVHISIEEPIDDILAYTFPRPAPPSPSSTEWSLPTPSQLERASSLSLIAPSGLRVPFPSLFASHTTVLVFLRHFWCSYCQDYASSIARADHQQIRLVLVSNGAPAYIEKYRAMLGLTCELYTDPDGQLYDALGMGKWQGKNTTDKKNSSYVKRGLVGGFATVVGRALKAGLPVWERGGDVNQLGGEFIMGPGMQSPKGHAPIHDVFAAAGVVTLPPSPSTNSSSHQLPPRSHTPTPSLTLGKHSRIKQYASTLLPGKSKNKKLKTALSEAPSTSTPNLLLSISQKGKSKDDGERTITGTGRGKENKSGRLHKSSKSIFGVGNGNGNGGASEFGKWRTQTRRGGSLDSGRMLGLGIGSQSAVPVPLRNVTAPLPLPPPERVYEPEPEPKPELIHPPSHALAHPYTSHHPSHSETALPSASAIPLTHTRRRSAQRSSIDSDLPDWTFGLEKEQKWMRERQAGVDALKEMKRERRGVFVGYFTSSSSSDTNRPTSGSYSYSSSSEGGNVSGSGRKTNKGMQRRKDRDRGFEAVWEEDEDGDEDEGYKIQSRYAKLGSGSATRRRRREMMDDPDISDVMVVGFGREEEDEDEDVDEHEHEVGGGDVDRLGDESWVVGHEEEEEEEQEQPCTRAQDYLQLRRGVEDYGRYLYPRAI